MKVTTLTVYLWLAISVLSIITTSNLEKLNSKAERARREAKMWTDKAAALAKVNGEYDKKERYSEDDIRLARLKAEKEDLAIKRTEMIGILTRPNDFRNKLSIAASGGFWKDGKFVKNISTEGVNQISEQMAVKEREIQGETPVQKSNATQILLDEARKASKLDAEKAEERWGKGWKKVQEDITNTIPTVMSKEILSMTNIAGLPGQNIYGADKVNKTQEELLRKLMDKRAEDPSSASSKASELERKKGLKITGNGNRQFNITINGGLVNQENTFERGDYYTESDKCIRW